MNLFDRFFRTDADDGTPTGGRDDRRGLILSLAAHGLLVLLMVVGFSTAPDNPGPVQVELWAQGTVADAAAPQEQPEQQQPEPQPKPEPKPEPEPTPQPEDSARQAAEQAAQAEAARQAQLAEAQARAAEAAQAKADAEIALAKERKAREEMERRLAEQAAKEKAQKAAAEQAARDKAAKEKAEKEKAEKAAAEKAAAEKAAAEQAAKEAAKEKAAKAAAAKAAAEKAAAEKAAAEKAAREKAAKEKAAKEAEAKRQALRAAMRGDALEAAGIPNGNADRNQRGGGGSDGYAAKVRACVQPGVVYNVPPRNGSANPTASFRTRLGANGQVQGVDLTRSSGNPRFDDAVQKGIVACSPFPKPPGGKYPSYIDVDYRMYD